MSKAEKYLRKQNIQPIQIREDTIDYFTNYDLFTSVDVIKLMQSYHESKLRKKLKDEYKKGFDDGVEWLRKLNK